MTRVPCALLVLLLALTFTPLVGGAAPAVPAASGAADLLAPVRSALKAGRAALAKAPAGSLDEARLALETGDFGRVRRVLDALVARDTADFEAIALRARLDLSEYRFAGLQGDLERALRLGPNHPDTRRLQFRRDFVTDDLGAVETRFGHDLKSDSTDPVALLYAARFEQLTLRYDRAVAAYQRALRHAQSGPDSVHALSGLGACWLQKGDRDAALRYQVRALSLRGADDDLLVDLANTLIKLGRAREGMDALELAAEINPCSENAHYLLGNGYARLNYTELRAKYPGVLADSAAAPAFLQTDSLLWGRGGAGDVAAVRVWGSGSGLAGRADFHAHLGSWYYEQGNPDSALARFQAALRLCPDYGRAHNGIARSLELYRRNVDVHRDVYEAAFAAAPVPDIPGLEKFVVNYASLSPRIGKRVALSIAPWKAFVPVLVEGGCTFYIKHLHELLSECPGQGVLRNQRIGYDLRLWDDVRGCGGYRTVTGIEDVEGTLRGRYNTVLHELTHQVHGVLTADLAREIQELYRRARARMDAGQEAFVSLYQASSVFEYLAEGANSWFSPRRDPYDTREMTRERLVERDTALASEIVRLTSITDVGPYYAVAYGGAAGDRMEQGRADEAVAFYRKAQGRDPASEDVSVGLAYALSVLGRGAAAVAVADSGLARHPESGSLWLQRILAEYGRTGDRGAELAALRSARPGVDARERYLVDQALGRAALDEGRTAEARAAADSVLAYQSDNPEGLELRGEVETAAGAPDSARACFDRAVRVRSGWIGLRVAYASALLAEHGKAPRAAGAAVLLDDAAKQIEAARLADPDEPRVAMLEGWLELERGPDHRGPALERLDRALAAADWLDLARILRARAGDPRGAERDRVALAGLEARLSRPTPPRYVYNPRQSTFERVGDLGWVEKAQLAEARRVIQPR